MTAATQCSKPTGRAELEAGSNCRHGLVQAQGLAREFRNGSRSESKRRYRPWLGGGRQPVTALGRHDMIKVQCPAQNYAWGRRENCEVRGTCSARRLWHSYL